MTDKDRVLRFARNALLLLVLAGVGYMYVGFWGNPFVKMTMRSKVMNYLTETYPTTDFTFERATYNFKVGAYGGVVHPVSDPEVKIHVNRTGSGKFSDNFLRARLESEMLAAVTPMIDTTIPLANIFVTVFARDEALNPEDVHFSPDMDADIFLVVRWKGESISKQDFADQVAATIHQLQDGNWSIDDWLFCYSYDNYELILNLQQGSFSLANLVDHVKLSKQKE